MTITWDLVAEIARNITVIAILLIIIISGAKGVWQFTWQVKQQMEQYASQCTEANKREEWWKDAFFRLADSVQAHADVSKALKDEVVKHL